MNETKNQSKKVNSNWIKITEKELKINNHIFIHDTSKDMIEEKGKIDNYMIMFNKVAHRDLKGKELWRIY